MSKVFSSQLTARPVETTLFGVRLFSSDMPAASEFIGNLAVNGSGGYVCVANVDMVTRAKRDSKLFSVMQRANMVVTDGLPLVWALRKKGLKNSNRIYGPALMLALCARAEHAQFPIFLYGGTDLEVGLLVAALIRRHPRLKIAGAVSPPTLPSDPPFDADAVKMINATGARFVFVGLGCPKQEYWMYTHAAALDGIAIGVGLAFAQIAGTKAPAPIWMQDSGLEWLYRLGQEPRRLWARYLVGNSLFIWYCMKAGIYNLMNRHPSP